LRNLLIVYYFIKFNTECPAKNGKNRRFFKTICIFEIIVYARLYPAELIQTAEEVRDLFGQNPAYKQLCSIENG